jgi:hypothetical protein
VHSGESSHAIVRSLEPGETWCWCFIDEQVLAIPEIHGATQIPPSPMLLG